MGTWSGLPCEMPVRKRRQQQRHLAASLFPSRLAADFIIKAAGMMVPPSTSRACIVLQSRPSTKLIPSLLKASQRELVGNLQAARTPAAGTTAAPGHTPAHTLPCGSQC